MKKKLIIIAFIFILIMFVPIPMGTYDDGTMTYNALTYKIVKWDKADLRDILIASEQWKALPEDDVFID